MNTKTAYEFKAAVSYDIMIIPDEKNGVRTLEIYARQTHDGQSTGYMYMFGLQAENTTIEEAYKTAVANLPDYMEMFEDGEG